MALTWRPRTGGEELHVSLAAGTLTLSFSGRINLSFDGEGRMVGAWYAGRTYRRSLDNRVLLKWTDSAAPAQRHRRFLPSDDAREVVNRAYDDARRACDGIESGGLAAAVGDSAEVAAILTWLRTLRPWSYAALEQDAERFRGIYKPVSILPPDQYLSVVLQATEGCSYNECSFCTFYRDRRFRIKGVDEFAAHLEHVREFVGRGLYVRRSIFLADANAIVIPQARLLPLLDIVNERFTFEPRNDAGPAVLESPCDWSPAAINAFVSAPDALRKSVDDLRELAHRNVRTLYVGLETGHDPLRRFLRKPGNASNVSDAVDTIKQAGLHVGLIFMAGVGGEVHREQHFVDTVNLIQRLPLGPGDLIYVSPFVPAADSPYLDDMQRAGYSSLDTDAIPLEERRFRAALLPWAKQRGVRVSRYDIREFVY